MILPLPTPGRPILHTLIAENDAAGVRDILMTSPRAAFSRDAAYNTAAHAVAAHPAIDEGIARAVLAVGSVATYCNAAHDLPLHAAARQGDRRTALLIAHAYPRAINMLNARGCLPLHEALDRCVRCVRAADDPHAADVAELLLRSTQFADPATAVRTLEQELGMPLLELAAALDHEPLVQAVLDMSPDERKPLRPLNADRRQCSPCSSCV